jgi:hypothetical protein
VGRLREHQYIILCGCDSAEFNVSALASSKHLIRILEYRLSECNECTSDTFLVKLGLLEAQEAQGQVQEAVGSWTSVNPKEGSD